jgi:lipoyl-dependent peroxiredoxin
MKRFATSVWNGSGKEGSGHLTTQSATLDQTPYSFNTRFGDGKGTNPEELIAAAHAGCFNMALSFALSGAGFAPESLTTLATLTMEQQDGGFTITAIHLDLKAKVPGIDADQFAEIAAGAKANCPVSKVLNAEISLGAELIE